MYILFCISLLCLPIQSTMADKERPTSNPDGMTETEVQKLVATLSAMKIKPKADTQLTFCNGCRPWLMLARKQALSPKHRLELSLNH